MIVQRARISPIMRIFSVPFVSPIPHSRKTPSRKSRRISSSFKERMSMKRQNVHGLGSMKRVDKMYESSLPALIAHPDQDLPEALAAAIANLPSNVYVRRDITQE